jgi:pimeloyl-ACP methyl ester carboxylesterase
MRRLAALLIVLLGLALVAPAAAADPRTTGWQTHEGTIDGAKYLVKVPHRWNGTLVLFSHGYYPEKWGLPPETLLATAPGSEKWLLEHGYALATSDFANPFGFAMEDALRDQIALLDWFDDTIGEPRRVLSNGMSQGGGIAIVLAERHPRRFDGVLATCSEYDFNGTWNSALDINFATRTLLTDDDTIELVRPTDAEASVAALSAGIADARDDAAGLAKLALIGALGNVSPWANAHQPAPTDVDAKIQQMANWIDGAYTQGVGPLGRLDLEARAGGNPSWNVGVDYARQLAKSEYRDLVVQAYAKAGLDLNADLAELAAAPRIAPDAKALKYMYSYGVPRATNPVPTISLHNTHDGGAVVDQARWYADQVDRFGNPSKLRQVYVNRGNHCAVSAAEEISALRAVERRVETGRWPDTRPGTLNAAAGGFAPEYHEVKDLFTWEDEPMPPAFVEFEPPRFLRPSR